MNPIKETHGVWTDVMIEELQKRNAEKLREAIRRLGDKYVLAGTRKPNSFGYYPTPLTSTERS